MNLFPSLSLGKKKAKAPAQQKVTTHTFKTKKPKKTAMVFFVRFPIKDQVHFAKRLSFLIGAGVPVLESLELLRTQTKSSGIRHIYEQVIHDVTNGVYLSTSLARYKKHFGVFAINIIKIGETGGVLTQNLNYLAEELKKKEELRRKVVGALIYPAFISVATLLLAGVLTVFIFPKVMPIFQSLSVDLPITTIFLLWLSNFLAEYGLYLIAGIIVFIIAFRFLVKHVGPIRLVMHHITLRIPLMGRLTKYYYMSNFCRTLGLLLKSGVNIVEAITITGETMTSDVYRNECMKMSAIVTKGERISTYLEKRPQYFPDFTAHLVSVGERSGNLSDTLMYLAKQYEDDVTEMTKNLSNVIEPILMIFMGLIVGFVAVSVIAPIYEVTQHLNT